MYQRDGQLDTGLGLRHVESSKFSYQNFALRNSRYGIFYGYNLLTWVCHVMSGHGMFTHKKDAPEDKDPSEGKELSNLSGPYLSKVIPTSSS